MGNVQLLDPAGCTVSRRLTLCHWSDIGLDSYFSHVIKLEKAVIKITTLTFWNVIIQTL